MQHKAVRFHFKVAIATKSDMAWHPDAAKNRAEREQGIFMRYADDGWVLSRKEAAQLIVDLETILRQLEKMK